MQKFVFTLLTIMVSSLAMAQGEEIVLAPQWTAQAQFAGYYAAEVKGFYREAGLNVRIKHPSSSNSSTNMIKEGKADFITLHLISAMKNIAAGLPLINLLQTAQSNSQMIISHKPIKDVSDLKGLRVGRWKVGYAELGLLVDRIHHLDIEWIPYIQNVNLFISGAIDATMAMTYNEYYQLLMSGQYIEKDHVLYFRDIGYNIPEDGLYVSTDYYRKHPKEVLQFVKASKKGWEWVAKHPEEALDIVMEVTKANHVKTNRAAQRWMLNEILNVMKDPKSGLLTYHLKESSLQQANSVLLQNHTIKEAITYQQITRP